MADYVSTSDVNTFLWISGEDTLITQLIPMAEKMVNNFCRVDTFDEHTIEDEEHDFDYSWPYYLKHSVVDALTEINWATFSWDYKLNQRKLRFPSSENLQANSTDWNEILFSYTAGFDIAGGALPKDIKLATLLAVWFLYNERKAQGIKSFTQWDLSVNFSKEKDWTQFKSLLSPYKIINVVS